MSASKLTEQQQRFCEEYIIDLNATRAYMVAYPAVKKESSASSCAAKLLRIAKVRNFIQELKQERQKRVIVDQDEVIQAIMDIAFNVGTKDRDRLKALEMLCRHLGVLDRKTELDRREQEARIAKLEREAKAEDEGREIRVSIMGMGVDELPEIIG